MIGRVGSARQDRPCRCALPGWAALFFVRVNQVLVRLWARRGRMSDRMAMGACWARMASSDPAVCSEA